MKITNEEYRYIQDTEMLTDALFNQHTLDYIVNKSYKIFKNPVFVMDANFKLISRSDSDADDTIWMDLSQNGYYSYESLRLAKIDQRYATAMRSRRPIIFSISEETRDKFLETEYDCECLSISSEHIKYSRLIVNIFDKNRRVGSVTILETETPLEVYDVKLAIFLAKLILIQIKQNIGPIYSSGAPLEALYMDLVNENINTIEILNERFAFFNYKPKKHFLIMAVSFIDSSNSPEELKPYRTALTQLFPAAVSLIFNNCILFIFNQDSDEFISSANERKILEMFKDNHLYAGVSDHFENPIDIKKQSTNAIRSMMLGIKYYPRKYLVYHTECVMLEISDMIKSTYHNPRDFCHPAVNKLVDYDNIHGTQYIPTLAAYIQNVNNLQAAAQSLDIHRNSLSYRLNKIEEITGASLTDMQTLYHIYISYIVNEQLF